jgi:hypothetical protein
MPAIYMRTTTDNDDFDLSNDEPFGADIEPEKGRRAFPILSCPPLQSAAQIAARYHSGPGGINHKSVAEDGILFEECDADGNITKVEYLFTIDGVDHLIDVTPNKTPEEDTP